MAPQSARSMCGQALRSERGCRCENESSATGEAAAEAASCLNVADQPRSNPGRLDGCPHIRSSTPRLHLDSTWVHFAQQHSTVLHLSLHPVRWYPQPLSHLSRLASPHTRSLDVAIKAGIQRCLYPPGILDTDGRGFHRAFRASPSSRPVGGDWQCGHHQARTAIGLAPAVL